MNCPKCNSNLKAKKVIDKPYSLYIKECMGCAGWWFDDNDVEEYRASIVPTSQYTVLPKFTPITAQTPMTCCSCGQKTLLWNNVDSHTILSCSTCFGVFLSKTQVFDVAQYGLDPAVETGIELGLWVLFLNFIFGR